MAATNKVEVHGIHGSKFPQEPEEQANTMKFILTTSFAAALTVPFLPQEIIDGRPVPSIIFRGKPSLFHGFLICIMFAFTGSFSALMIRDKLNLYVKFCRFCSKISIASAFSILFYALVSDGFNKWKVSPI